MKFRIVATMAFLALLSGCFDSNSKNDGFSLHLQNSMEKSGQFRFSDVVSVDKICVFNQDDSDQGVAFRNLAKYLQKNEISAGLKDNSLLDSQNILLFVSHGKGTVYSDKVFLVNGQKFQLQGSLSEDIRVACHSPHETVKIVNGKLVIGEK